MTQTPAQRMYAAVTRGDATEVQCILGSDPEQLHGFPGVASSWLHFAAAEDKLTVVDVFLAAGLDVNWGRRNQADTPLVSAIAKGNIETAKHLFALGANPNLGREFIAAINAKNNQFELVKLLVEHGADVNRCWRFGDEEKGPRFNALSWAINSGREDIADYLRAHGAVMPSADAPMATTSAADEIIAFFKERFGEVDRKALGEIAPASDRPIIVHRVGPGGARNSQILFTTGMSDVPMRAPAKGQDYRFAELLIELPADWPLSQERLSDQNHRWPIDWLRKVAAYPRQEQTWLGGPFAIMSNGEPAAPFAPGCGFAAMLILAGYDGVGPVKLGSGKLVQIYTLVPLFAEEKELEQREDLPELFRRLDQFGVGRMVNVNRANVAAHVPASKTKRKT